MKSVSLVSLKDQAAAALRREIYAGELPDGAELRQEDITSKSINQSMNMMTRMRWKRMKMNPKIQNLKSGK